MNEKDLFLKKFEEKLKQRLDSKTYEKLSNKFEFGSEQIKSTDYEQFRIETLPTEISI